MTPENFVYWLQGYFEISAHNGAINSLNDQQVEEIKNHLKLVLQKVTTDPLKEATQLTLPFPSFPHITYC